MDGVDELQPGDHLGRYVVQRRLGSGAAGTVYSAFDPQLDRAVAIKLLRAEAASERARAGFLREAQATARLIHRNVVTIHDVGIVGERLFIAMELIDGPTLRQWLAPGRRWKEALAVLREAGEGLVAAHDAGIVHRDFKPDNVLLASASGGGAGRVVVSDFGLARRAEDSTTSDIVASVGEREPPPELLATHEGIFQGTLAYAAPEQKHGGHCDARADQYSFCVTLHEALWGERPTDGVVRADRSVPRWLRRALQRGLAEDPNDRHPDMRALLRALDPRRWRPPLALVVGAGALAAAGVAIALDTPEPARSSYCEHVEERLVGIWDEPNRREIEAAFLATGEPSAADAWTAVSTRIDAFASAWVTAQAEACQAELDGSVVGETLALRMTCLDRQLVRTAAIADALHTVDREAVLRSADAVTHLDSPELCADDRQLSRRAEGRANIDKRTQAELDELVTRAEALSRTARYAESKAAATLALARAKELGDRWAEAEAALALACALQWVQEPAAEQAFHDTLSAALAIENHHVAALAMIGMLELWNPSTPGGITRAEQWERHCTATISALGGNADLEIELAVAVGNVYLKYGRYDEAEAAYARAFAIPRADDADILLAGAHANMAAIAAARGHYRDALVGFRSSHELLIGSYGPRHPNTAGAGINLGSALAETGDLEGARVQHLAALEILEENFGPEHASLAPALRMLAWNALARRKFAEALPFAERALVIARRESGERSESTARSLSMISAITVELGRVEEARTQSATALAIARETFGADHPTLSEFEIECGITATRAGDEQAARAHFARAIALRERTLGPTDGEIGRAWAGIAELELVVGNADAAVQAATKGFAITSLPEHERGGAGAESAFLLARALVARGTAADRIRARELAEQARDGFLATGPGWKPRADEIADWLASQR